MCLSFIWPSSLRYLFLWNLIPHHPNFDPDLGINWTDTMLSFIHHHYEGSLQWEWQVNVGLASCISLLPRVIVLCRLFSVSRKHSLNNFHPSHLSFARNHWAWYQLLCDVQMCVSTMWCFCQRKEILIHGSRSLQSL